MGRKRVWPPSILHHKPTDTDRVRHWVGDRRVEVTLGRHGSPEARANYARLLAELEAGRTARRKSDPLTCCELIVEYTNFAAGYHEGGQLARIRRALQGVLELYADTPVDGFGPIALEAVRHRFVAERPPEGGAKVRGRAVPEGGLSRTYINSLVRCIQGCWAWGVRKEFVPVERYQALLTVPALRKGKTAARESAPVMHVEPDVVEKTLPFLLPQTAAMVRLQMYTGCRPGEVCRLRPMDLDKELLKVDGVPIWIYTPFSHKNAHRGQTRKAALGPRAQAALLPFLDRDPSSFCFSPREAVAQWMHAHGRPYRPNPRRPHGARYQVSSYDHAVRNACAKAGVPPWHPHQLRHLAATIVEELVDEEAARALLGHKGLAMTKRYAHADLLKAAKVAALMG